MYLLKQSNRATGQAALHVLTPAPHFQLQINSSVSSLVQNEIPQAIIFLHQLMLDFLFSSGALVKLLTHLDDDRDGDEISSTVLGDFDVCN